MAFLSSFLDPRWIPAAYNDAALVVNLFIVALVFSPREQEHRLVLRVERLDVPDPVVLLVRAGELVDLHPTGVVVLDAHDRHHAGLHDVAHRQPVDRVRRHVVALEHPAREELLEVRAPSGVDLG